MMRFNGAQPVSIERKHFKQLLNNRYMVCEKTDGIRHFLIREDGDPYMMNRALVKTPVNIRIPKNTYLDGEYVDGNIFYVYDAMMIGGENVCELNLIQRMDKAVELIKKTPVIRGGFKMVPKNHVPLSDVGTLDPFREGNDGLIFTPVDEPVRYGTHETLFKWKPSEHITVDFMYDRDGFLCTQAGAVAKANFRAQVGSIVECKFNEGKWELVKVRTDKTHSNNKRTFERTLVNIREGIKFSEFIKLSNGLEVQR